MIHVPDSMPTALLPQCDSLHCLGHKRSFQGFGISPRLSYGVVQKLWASHPLRGSERRVSPALPSVGGVPPARNAHAAEVSDGGGVFRS